MPISTLLARAQRKGGRLLREWLPRNGHFRPVGIHPESRHLGVEPTAQATYYEVVPAHLSHTAIPPAFFDAASAYGGHLHSKPAHTEAVPAAFVLELRQGRLYADNNDSVAIMAADDRLVGDASFQYTNKTWETIGPADNNIFRQRYFLEPVEVPGTVCSLLAGGGAAIGNYYHWLIDSLPRLHLLKAAGLLRGVDYFLVYNRDWDFVRQTLTPLGIRPEQIIDVRTHRHLRAGRLLVTSPVRGTATHTPEWACDFLRASYLPPDPALVEARQFAPYVLISRRDAGARHLRNEAAVEELLRPYGFRPYVLSQLSFAEKVTLFAGARAVVAPAGAGSSNLAFCAPGTPVLELLPPSFVVPDFMELSYRLGLRYHWLVGHSARPAATLAEARCEDMTIAPDALRACLTHLLGQPAEVVA